jgi:hypothetical protein
VLNATFLTKDDGERHIHSRSEPGEAIAMLQKWAARTHRTVQIVFTIGVEPWACPATAST